MAFSAVFTGGPIIVALAGIADRADTKAAVSKKTVNCFTRFTQSLSGQANHAAALSLKRHQITIYSIDLGDY